MALCYRGIQQDYRRHKKNSRKSETSKKVKKRGGGFKGGRRDPSCFEGESGKYQFAEYVPSSHLKKTKVDWGQRDERGNDGDSPRAIADGFGGREPFKTGGICTSLLRDQSRKGEIQAAMGSMAREETSSTYPHIVHGLPVTTFTSGEKKMGKLRKGRTYPRGSQPWQKGGDKRGMV